MNTFYIVILVAIVLVLAIYIAVENFDLKPKVKLNLVINDPTNAAKFTGRNYRMCAGPGPCTAWPVVKSATNADPMTIEFPTMPVVGAEYIFEAQAVDPATGQRSEWVKNVFKIPALGPNAMMMMNSLVFAKDQITGKINIQPPTSPQKIVRAEYRMQIVNRTKNIIAEVGPVEAFVYNGTDYGQADALVIPFKFPITPELTENTDFDIFVLLKVTVKSSATGEPQIIYLDTKDKGRFIYAPALASTFNVSMF